MNISICAMWGGAAARVRAPRPRRASRQRRSGHADQHQPEAEPRTTKAREKSVCARLKPEMFETELETPSRERSSAFICYVMSRALL